MRRRKHEEHENHERWLVSYADFITLLFAFFVVLYATSSQNEEKEKKFEESIKANFKLLGVTGNKDQNLGNPLGQVFDPLDMISKRNVGSGELEDAIERVLQKNMSEAERKTAITGLRHDRSGVRIMLPAANLFPSGSAKLRLPALKALDRIAEILKLSNREIVIEGHTDDQNLVSGAMETNWELASLRATSVVRYLLKYHKIPGSQLSAASYADQRPLAPNDTEENRTKNRRIEIFILNRTAEK